MKRTLFKRFIPFLLSLCMLAALIPAGIIPVFAADGSVSATIYIDNGDGMYEDSEKVDTFAHDQQGLILDLRGFTPTVESGWVVESLAFYPADGSSEWGTVFWYNGSGDYFCDNGTPLDKLENGVFQLNNFTPNGNQPLTPGDYKILVYVGNNDSGDYQETLYYSTEIFTLSEEGTSANDPVIVTSSLPDATYKQPYTYMMNGVPSTTGSTLTWSAENLPQGLTIDASTGIINGTPTEDGSFEVRFTVTENDKSASKTLNLNVYREQSSVQWETVEVKLSNHLKNVESNYTFTLVPTEEFTPDAGTELKISNFDTDFTGSTFVLPDGITAVGSKDELTLTFDGSATVPAEGLIFTAENALNGEINRAPYIDKMIYEDAEIDWTYFLTIFYADSVQYTLRIPNYADLPLKEVNLRAELYGSSDIPVLNYLVSKDGTVIFPIDKDMHGKEYKIKLTYYDYVFAESSPFTADAYAAQEDTLTLDIDDYSIMSIEPNVKTKNIIFEYTTDGSGQTKFYPRITNKNKYLVKISELEEIIADGRAKISCSFVKITDNYDYDINDPEIYIDEANAVIHVDYRLYDQSGSISGKVTDENGEPIVGARVSLSPESVTNLSASDNLYTITDENGAYSFTQLRSELSYTVSVSLDGYKTTTLTAGDGQSGIGKTEYSLNFQLEKSGIIEVIVDGGSILNAALSVYNNSNKYVPTNSEAISGRLYHITYYPGRTASDKLSDGTYTIDIRGSNIEPLKVPVEIVNGYGQVTITPTFYAEIVFPNNGYVLNAYLYKDGDFWQLNQYNQLPEGDYTLYITQNRYVISNYSLLYSSLKDIENDCAAGTAKKTNIKLINGETFTIDSSMLPTMINFAKGTVDAPSSAKTGEIYKITGIIENPDVEKITIIPTNLSPSYSMNSAIKQISINGKIPVWYLDNSWSDDRGTVTIEKSAENISAGKSNEDLWTFPMYYTIYVEQCANSLLPSQGYTVAVNLENSSQNLLVGSAVTSWSPEITFSTVNAAGKSSDGETPGSFYFTGETPPYKQISIFDNGKLIAQIKSNSYGYFEGKAQLTADGSRNHTITAQYIEDTTVVQGTDTLIYTPDGPILTDLVINNKYSVRIDGGKSSVVTGLRNIGSVYNTFVAYFENADQLGDMTVTIDGEEVTGKVFFRISDGNTYKLYKAEQREDGGWSKMVREGTSIKVLYTAAETETKVDIEGQSIEFDGSYSGTTNENSTLFDWDDLTNQITQSASQSNFSLMSASNKYSTYANSAESEKLYQAKVNALGGDFSALDAQTAASDATEFHEYRTYIDEPSWSQSSLVYKVQELRGKGYKSYCYEDKDGRQYLLFTGSFYYDKLGMPVKSLYKQVTDGGIRKVIEDERMFQGGQMVGSMLTVNYVCDVKYGKWYRTQAALVPAHARSPIHTVSTQIPCAVDAPYSYTPASQLSNVPTELYSDSASMKLMADTRAGGGICGIRFKIDPSKVSAKTYTDGAMMIIMFGAGKLIKSETWLLKASDDIEWKSLTFLKDGKLSTTLTEYGSKLQIGLKQEDLIMGGVGFGIGQLTGLAIKGQDTASLPDTFNNLRDRLTKNLRWWGSTGSDAVHTSEYMKYRTSKLLNSLTDLEDELMRAQAQNQFTADTTNGMMFLSLAASFAPGVGTASSLTLDSLALLLNAANDTRNAETVEKVNKFIAEYEDYFATDKDSKDTWKVLTDKEYNTYDDPMYDGFEENPDSNITWAHDPSGYVYEAVLSNPVEDAMMTLYYADDGSGQYIQEGETDKYDSAVMRQHDDYFYLKQDNPIYTDEQGYYRWDVPKGLWYVTATADGYLNGSSNADIAATVEANGINWLPVLPPQLEVNIPLVNTDPPEIEEIITAPDGVYIRFTKYIDESTLIKGNFALSDPNKYNEPIDFTLEHLDSEQAPDNIDYGDGISAPSYTRTVWLKADLSMYASVTVGVSPDIKSYAGSTMEQEYKVVETVTSKQTASAPTASPDSGSVAKYSGVTLTSATDGAKIYYTTDGTAPSENSTLYTSPIIIADATTIKAIAVRYGMNNSTVATFTYQLDASDSIGSVPAGPQFAEKPSNASYDIGEEADPLRVTVYADNGDLVTFSWYASTDGSTTNGRPVKTENVTATSGRASSEYTPSTEREGTAWYYCEIVNTSTGLTTVTDPVRVKVSEPSGGIIISHTVRFHTLGTSEIDSVRVIGNGRVSRPIDPVRDGYTFVGWYTDRDCTEEYDFDAIVTGDLTLYAKWALKVVEPTEWENPFLDVDEDDWFYDNVRFVHEHGLFNGITENLFGPNLPMTRAMLVTVLYRAEGKPAVTRNIPFADIDMNEYYADAVIWASTNGIVKGYDENTFGPDNNVTREQIAAILMRYADYKELETTQNGDLSQFVDEELISDWARENVAWAVGAELINGRGNGILDPLGDATRAEVAAILQRFLENLVI